MNSYPEPDIRRAYHEAGHALVGSLVGCIIKSVTIVPSGIHFGIASVWVPMNDRGISLLVSLYGGIAAELFQHPGERDDGWIGDAVRIREICAKYGHPDLDLECSFHQERLHDALTHIINNQQKLHRIADALLLHRTISGGKVRSIMTEVN